ncbi:MAG: tetratricopeptide repeat protein [Pirellulales bacterium]
MDPMETIGDTLQRAWQLHDGGSYAQAETLYRQILNVQPEHNFALFLLGRLELDVGRHASAVEHLSAAVKGDASQAVYLATLARAHQALGRHREAAAGYRAALELEPDATDYYVNLGKVLLQCGEAAEAIACYEKAVERDPALAVAYNGLGAALEQQGRVEEAIGHYRRAISLRPNSASAHYNLGTAMLKQGRPAEALQDLTTAVQLQPKGDAAQSNLAAAYHLLGREDEARETIDRAIELAPDEPDHHCSLATVLRYQGRPHDALASYERALALNPDQAEAAFGRALVLLSLGRYAEAWPGFESRLASGPGKVKLGEPRWDGSPLANRTLLIDAEKEPRDTIQFIRLVKLAQRRGGNVVVAVDPTFLTLLGESGFGDLVSRDEPLPKFEVQAPLLSLPGILGLELDTIPREVPYLDVDPGRVGKWRDALAPYRGLKVGIAWQGARAQQLDDRRSIPLDSFARLSKVAGVDLISLEHEEGDRPPAPFEIAFFDELQSGGQALLDTAAVIKSLDLVIASDSAAAHLAGALAVPVWLALNKTPDWRWLLDRDDSPWYPTMRLFRQESSGDWAGVFERIATELADVARRRNESS